MLDHEYGAHPIRHRNPTHRGEAKIGWGVLFEGIAKTLKRWVAVSLTSGDEHRAPGRETEQPVIYIGEGHSANARIVNQARNGEIAFAPCVLCGVQRDCEARAVYDSLPEHESARRVMN